MKLKGKAKAAFLRRMASGRRKKKGHHGTRSSKRRTDRKARHVKKRHHGKHAKHHRRKGKGGHHLGRVGTWLPDQSRLIGMGSAFVYGKAENAATGDKEHVLNKVPTIIARLGRAGNLGALIWAVGVGIRSPLVKSLASGVLHVAAYQNGRRKTEFSKEDQEFKLSGPRQDRSDEVKVEEYLNRQRR